jgi:hypothetical protein
MAISKFDRQRYADNLELYLPTNTFDNNLYDEIRDFIIQIPIPGCIKSDSTHPSSMRLFCSIFKLTNLHSCFTNPDFEELIYDTDQRRKIDAMMISSVFRPIDVVREFPHINQLIIETYIDCIANFKQASSKHTYVAKYLGDELEKKLFTKILSISSRQHLKVLLGLKCVSLNPVEVLDKSLNIANLKTDIALMNDNDSELEKWLKLRVVIAERLHRMGAGTQTDLDRLIEALQVEATYQDPVIYRKEDLDLLPPEVSSE